MASAIDTAAKRAKLAPRKNPYWHGISGGRGGLSLGYRRRPKGAGSWVAKIVIDGYRNEERIGLADDEPICAGALSFASGVAAALTWGSQQAVAASAAEGAKVPTVRLAIDTYTGVRRERAGRNGSENQLVRYVLNHELAETKLARLSAQAIEDWRAQLPKHLAPSSKNRLLADFRAALNAAATKYRHQIPAYIPLEIKVGTKVEAITATARRQLLSDAQVRAVVEAAFDVDPDDGDFGRMVLLAAATGARFSQLAALQVEDVQIANSRVMMPSSRKGKNRTVGERTAVPIGSDVIARLAPALSGRAGNEPLLLRWAYRKGEKPALAAAGSQSVTRMPRWVKDKRQAWQFAYETLELWTEAIKLTDVPADTVMYALRHSSIVRLLLKRLPVRVVAALHDTSSEMIEKHYSAYITDMTEDIAREAQMSFERGAGAVILKLPSKAV